MSLTQRVTAAGQAAISAAEPVTDAIQHAYDGIGEFAKLERVLAGVCLAAPLAMIAFDSWNIRPSISSYYNMVNAWAFYVPLTVAAMLFLVNGVVKHGHWYNRILGVALFGIILFDHDAASLPHFAAVVVFFGGNVIVMLRAQASWTIKLSIVLASLAVLAVAIIMDGTQNLVFWLEWVALLVIAIHYIFASATWRGYEDIA